MSEQTRRDWVLSIGQAAAGVAVAWTAGRAATPPASAALPPGVYLPSKDHLGHALMSADRYHSIPPGCPTDYVRPRQGPYRPLFFTESEFAFTCCFASRLLGDVPRDITEESAEWVDLRIASDAGVRQAEARIDPLYQVLATAYYGRKDSNEAPDLSQTFRNGFAWISDAANTRYGKHFVSLATEQQLELFESISDDRANHSEKNAGTELFTFLKTEVTRAFYTSRFGLTELDYKGNAFYAQSPGCPRR